jgi:hypothetical protein
MANPNPQPIALSAFEAPTLTIIMFPPTDITGWTFTLSIRKGDTIKLRTSTFNVVDLAVGIITFNLSSTDTGTTIGKGLFEYDIFRTNSGGEKRITWGKLSLSDQEWQPLSL